MNSKFIHLFFPRSCIICGDVLRIFEVESGICRSCMNRLEILLPGSRHCKRRDSNSYVCAVYSGRIASILISFKKGDAPAVYRSLVHIFLPHLQYIVSEYIMSSNKVILTYPPGSIKGLILRGYSHMNRFCRYVTKLMPELEMHNLFKRITLVSQKSLDRKGRTENMSNGIKLRSVSSLPVDTKETVLILDDVITTGSTLVKCRDLLYDAGFTQVYCMALLTD